MTVPERKPLDRSELLQMVEYAGLTQALLSHVQREKEKLVATGISLNELKTMTIDDFKNKTIHKLPPAAIEILENWLADRTKSVLESYKERNPDNTEIRLSSYLAPLRLHRLGHAEAPSELSERAKCYLACNFDPEYQKLVQSIQQISIASKKTDLKEWYEMISSLIEDPEKAFAKGVEHSYEALLCCMAFKLGNRKLAESILNYIENSEQNREEAQKNVASLKSHYAKNLTSGSAQFRSIKIATPDVLSCNLENMDVLAFCNKSDPENGFAFSQVLAIRPHESNEWYELGKEERKRLFPKDGSVYHQKGPRFPPLPKVSSYAVWQVAMQALSPDQMEKHATHVGAIRKVEPVHQIVLIEHISSNQRNLARQWLRNTAELSSEAEGERVIRFDDGWFAHTTSSWSNLIEESFTQKLRAWKKLSAVKVAERVLHIGKLPDTDKTVDLMPPVEALKHSLQETGEHTKHELASLYRALDELGNNHALAARLKELETSELEFEGDELDALTDVLSKNYLVEEKIDKLVSEHTRKLDKSIGASQSRLEEHEALLEDMEAALGKRRAIVKDTEDELHKRLEELRKRFQSPESRELFEAMKVATALYGLDEEERRSP